MRFRNYIHFNPSTYIFIAFSIVYFAWMISCDTYFDDWIYKKSSGETFDEFWNCTGGSIQNLGDAFNSCINHYHHSNGRLADKIVIFSNLLPDIISRVIHALCLGLTLYFSSILCFRDKWKISIGGTAILSASIIFLLPWNDYFNASAINYNYLLSATLNLPIIISYITDRHRYNSYKIYIYILAPIAGMMHEGFSIPILAGMLLHTLTFHKSIKPHHITLFLTYFIGALILLIAPGTIKRISDVSLCNPTFEWSLHTLFMYTPPFWLITIVSIYISIRHGIKELVKRYIFNTFILTAGIIGFSIGVYTMMRGRAEWMPGLMFIIASYNILWGNNSIFKLQKTIGITISVISILWLLTVAQQQYEYSQEQQKIESEIAFTDIIFADISNFQTTPWWMFDTPHPLYCNHHYSIVSISNGIRAKNSNKGIVVLPTKFTNKHYSEWDRPGGTNTLFGEYPIYYSPKRLGEVEITFNLTEAPISHYNILNKISGTTTLATRQAMYEIQIPSSKTPSKILEQFKLKNGTTSTYPDTLYFYYLAPIPRKCIGANIELINE